MSQRITRVNELLKREISTCIERDFEFPEVLVTIHDVETARDLEAARVFVGIIGSEVDTAGVVETLNARRGHIQSVVMKRVVLRNTPQLTFIADDSVERGVKILGILDELEEAERAEQAAGNGEGKESEAPDS